MLKMHDEMTYAFSHMLVRFVAQIDANVYQRELCSEQSCFSELAL